MPLYGHELTDDIDPLTAGLQFAVKTENHDFIGKEPMLAKGSNPAMTRVGLKVTGRGVVREHAPLFVDGRQVGETTSGTMCPTVNMSIAMAYVETALSAVGTAMEAEVRGRRIPMEIIPLPFYSRTKKA